MYMLKLTLLWGKLDLYESVLKEIYSPIPFGRYNRRGIFFPLTFFQCFFVFFWNQNGFEIFLKTKLQNKTFVKVMELTHDLGINYANNVFELFPCENLWATCDIMPRGKSLREITYTSVRNHRNHVDIFSE